MMHKKAKAIASAAIQPAAAQLSPQIPHKSVIVLPF
jgi:hypothetical protein